LPAILAPAALILALVQAPAPSPSPTAPAPCAAALHRQFDFWIGEWDVINQRPPAGRTPPPAKSRITRILNGCAILEEYETVAGYAGKSLNFYDDNDRQWHQTWIDTGAAPLLLWGGIEGGSMVLVDQRRSGANEKTWTQRITWTPLPGGRVRQHWEKSSDGGRTTETVFEGVYAPRTAR
jgi:hypothetical protein